VIRERERKIERREAEEEDSWRRRRRRRRGKEVPPFRDGGQVSTSSLRYQDPVMSRLSFFKIS
jgi:hypothetical protein